MMTIKSFCVTTLGKRNRGRFERTRRRELETLINNLRRTWKELQATSKAVGFGMSELRTFVQMGDTKVEVKEEQEDVRMDGSTTMPRIAIASTNRNYSV